MSLAGRRLPLLAAILVLVLPLTARPALAYAGQLLRYPYLIDVVGGYATVNWGTDRSSVTGYATYGKAGTESCTAHRAGASKTGVTVGSALDIAFSGHAHMYERNLRQPGDGFVSYLTGGGGGKLQPIGAKGCSAFDAYGIGWSNSKNQGSACGAALVPDSITRVFHFLLVTVQGTRVTVAPTDELGRTFDVRTYDF